MTALVSGFVLGLAGSVHCVLMCGPLASLSVARRSRVGYHAGRVLTYLALGSIAGSFGAAASLAGAGRAIAVVSGVWLIGLAAWRLHGPAGSSTVQRGLTNLLARLARPGRRSLRSTSLMFGIVNGLLPCGLVYGAVIAAAGFGGLTDGLAFLAAFGAGTIPLLAVTSSAAPAIARRLPLNARLAGTVALVVIGMLLIARGVTVSHAHGEVAAAASHADASHRR